MNIRLVADQSRTEGGLSLSKIAWCNSRSWDDKTPIQKIFSIDAPVNDFPSYVLDITSSIIVREIIASMRGHVMWSRTSRVDDVINFTYDTQFLNEREIEDIEDIRNKMIKLKNDGVRQDEYRLLAPIISDTSYSVRVSLRTLIKLYRYFAHLSNVNVGSIRSMYGDAAIQFLNIIANEALLGCEYEKIIDAYKTVNIVPHLEENKMESGRVGDFIVVSTEVPFSLRTHLIRHNSLHIKDNIIELFSEPALHLKTINHKVNIQISASEDFWLNVLKERSCWMSHYGMWQQIMNELSDVVTLDKTFLPCLGEGEKCPYAGDAQQRVEGKDPNPPCPVYLNGNTLFVPHKTKQDIIAMWKDDSRPSFWFTEIMNIDTKGESNAK